MASKAVDPLVEEFTVFCRTMERPLRYALVGQFGYEAGREATQDALVYAWEHWDQLRPAANPGGYLYRVAKRRTLRTRRRPNAVVIERPDREPPVVEPGLDGALDRLSGRQRTVVLLVEGLGLTHEETSQLLGISRSAVQSPWNERWPGFAGIWG